jgi:N-acylglucosamine 2-epimerase
MSSVMSEADVQSYLDTHKIAATVEEAINDTVKAHATDPFSHMANFLARKKQMVDGACAAEAKTLEALAAAWRKDLMENVVPFWDRHSIDAEYGGYFTCLDRVGNVLDESKYMWLQGRAVYMWSRLHNELRADVGDVKAERFFANAKTGAVFLEKGKRADGTLLFSVSRDGTTPLHFQRKPYAAVFYVLGCLEYGQALRLRAAGGEQAWFDEAIRYFELLRGWIDDPSKLGRESTAAPAADAADDGRPSVLADTMCLASIAEELLKKLPEQRERWLEHVADAQRRVAVHFDPDRQILMESASKVSGVSHVTHLGRLFNPGHSIEVAWFLLHLCELRPNAELSALALAALEGSLELGWDAKHGGLMYMMDVENKPLADCTVTAEHKLWWPMCEALYACTLAIEVTGDEQRWLPWLLKVHRWINDHLRDEAGGGEWFGYLREDGSVFNECKGANYKGFFHTPRALLASVQSAERYLAKKKAGT